ncbi:recombinase family protein [Thermogemmatispora sp.]|uniref:recombinase family protein n=1 Tax=Thermogemmatispora sp. TaxID=1968838 RepID=UPI003A102170
MQKDNYSLEAQKRAIREAAKLHGLPEPVFYEDDERSARGEHIAKRPAFKRLLEDVQAKRIRVVIVHTLDRWSRNVMVTLQSFRILSQAGTAFLSLSEHIDYSSPEGQLQLTILAAFAAYFSDSLARHTSKGKRERAVQGLHNGDIPFGYRSGGPKSPLEIDPDKYPGVRLIGELRMQGKTAEEIATALNAAGYRTSSKRFGDRLFTKDTINAMLRNEFYAAFAPGDDRGTIRYKGRRFRGQHQATFTYEEWQQIRTITASMQRAPGRARLARRVYEFAGYIVCAHCGLPLRSKPGARPTSSYYRDPAKLRQLPCPLGGHRMVKAEVVQQQFGQLLDSIRLPENWQDEIRKQLTTLALEEAGRRAPEQEKERLLGKRARLVKLYSEGYLSERDFEAEVAAVDLALYQLEQPVLAGMSWEEIQQAAAQLPQIRHLWERATTEERREWVIQLLEPQGLYYDLEQQMIAAINPRPSFAALFLQGEAFHTSENKEAVGLLVTKKWRERNRRDSNPRSPA